MVSITLAELKEAYPEIMGAFEMDIKATAHAEGYAEGFDKGKKEGLEAGGKAERDRIQSIDALGLAGHDKLMEELKFDGKSTAGDAAIKWAMADKELRRIKLEAFKSDAPPVVNIVEPKEESGKKDFVTLTEEYQKESGCKKSEAIRKIVADYPAIHQEYLDSLKPKGGITNV